ncbi:DUF5753 domain-containing protein [Kitasatospora sp. RB6PN24]|uniref:DUF5753 domain-containing protein n=1 Tax=Kitasatospora humi TaxID=2893891 RepID=UPI001E316508|nr:DUF5753 domain-containing protein [Kitasatospora humi]MCC9307307.1 DUF5753 domain-containing protein [Kitasatospora humi]
MPAKTKSATGVPFLAQVLGRRLRRLREQHGFTREQVAAELELSAFSVLRHETGETKVSVANILAYASLYKLSTEQVEPLKQLARQSKQRGWWTAIGANLHPAFAYLVEAELMAKSIRNWEPSVIPGLLQTEDYTKALLARAKFLWKEDNPLSLAEAVESRERRKQLLTATNAPKFWFIIGASALRMMVGDESVMRGQIHHLLKLCELANVTIQVMTEETGYHVGTDGPCVLFHLSEEPGDAVVYYENSLSFTDDAGTLKRHARQFELLVSQALDPAASRSYLQAILAA